MCGMCGICGGGRRSFQRGRSQQTLRGFSGPGSIKFGSMTTDAKGCGGVLAIGGELFCPEYND